MSQQHFADLQKIIDGIADPEERARFRREWGLLGLDRDGRPGDTPADGSGPQAQINQAAASKCLDPHGKKVRRPARIWWGRGR
jgi:hypothetical protein